VSSVVALVRRPWVAFGLDAVLVVVFAAVGRASHEEANPVVGALVTAWPFLVGTIVGWAVVRVLRKAWPLGVGPGITVWFATVVIGMVLPRRPAGRLARPGGAPRQAGGEPRLTSGRAGSRAGLQDAVSGPGQRYCPVFAVAMERPGSVPSLPLMSVRM
jgi:hypothetical protein